MDKLIKSTAAYRTFSNDVKSGKLSHAYMLYFDDAKNLRAALKMFALEFFGTEADKADGRRILSGSFTDCRIYPDEESLPRRLYRSFWRTAFCVPWSGAKSCI